MEYIVTIPINRDNEYMNKSQKSSKNSKPNVEKQFFIEKYLKKLTLIKNSFRKIWWNIKFFFNTNVNLDRYLFRKRPHNIRDFYKLILKYRSYGIDFLKKAFKWLSSVIFYIIIFLGIALIFMNNWFDFLVFIEYFWGMFFKFLFVSNFFVIFLVIIGTIWWFVTPDKYTNADFVLRARGFILRVLFAVIILSAIYFGISYPPLWFDELNITYDKQTMFFNNEAWFVIPRRLSSLHEPLNIRNIVIGVFGLASLIFLWWRNTIADDNLKLAERRRLDERFHEATETLSNALDSKTYPSHIGAISTLTQLALDSKEQTLRCLEVICSCNEWMRPFADEFKYDITQKCYSERELYRDISSVTGKSRNSKDLIDASEIRPKWERVVSLAEEKRSQKALSAVATILQEIGERESQEDYNFIKLSELNFRSVMLCGIDLKGLKLDGVDLRRAYLNGADLRNTILKNAKLQYTKLNWSILSRSNLEESDLTGAQLKKSILFGINLLRANMDDAELQGANLSHSKLSGATLNRSNLQFANLNNSSLYGTNLDYTQLQGASLQDTQLVGASLRETKLVGANMMHANLQATLFYEANLIGADLSEADLSYSIIWRTNFYGVVLNKILTNYHMIPDENYFSVVSYIKDKDIHPLIFNYISVNEYKRKIDREDFFHDIFKNSPSPEQSKLFKVRMNNTFKLMKNCNESKELIMLKKHSVIKKQGENSFVMDHNELVSKLQERWNEWARFQNTVTASLLLRTGTYFGVDIVDDLVSGYGMNLYKKLKKNRRLKKIDKKTINKIKQYHHLHN